MADVMNNLSGNTGTISGTTQHISDIQITEQQSDILIIGSFSILAILIICLFSLLKSYVTKSCSGCKRLRTCEDEIKQIKKDLMLNKIVDAEILKTIADDVAEVKKRITEYGSDRIIHN